jgi:hypothetical protein
MPTAQRTGRFLLFFFFFFLFFFFPNNRARSLYLCPSAAGGFIATFFLVQRPTIRLQRQGKEETWQRPTLGLQRQGSEGIPRAQEAYEHSSYTRTSRRVRRQGTRGTRARAIGAANRPSPTHTDM